MSLIKLRLSIVGTLAVIIGLSTLALTAVLAWSGTLNVFSMIFFVAGFNLLQWLIAPYLIDAMYGVRELPHDENRRLYDMVRNICQKTRMKVPRLMISGLSIPNAFAYGSPIAGNRVAVTKGLLDSLEEEEVEAVLGHELGHLKHRDVQVMMFASVLPAIFYYIGYSLMLSSFFSDRRREGGGYGVLIGTLSMAIYWVLTLFVLGLSRLREYYADQHSVMHVEDGSRKLSEGLVKIVVRSGRVKRGRDRHSIASFKALFISDPDRSSEAVTLLSAKAMTGDQRLVREVLEREVTTFDRIMEFFTTHPNIVKRLKALQKS